MGEYAEMALEQELNVVHAFGDTLIGEKLTRRRTNNFTEHRKAHDKVWKQRDGTLIQIKHMTDHHLQCAIALLDRNGQTNTKAYKGLTKERDGRAA